MRSIVRKLVATAAVLVLTTAVGLVQPGQAQAHSSCSVRWGSLPKVGTRMTAAPIFDVRAGRHACFDRLVIDVGGSTTDAYNVRYVPAVVSEGSGDIVPLRGGAVLAVEVNAPAYDPWTGVITYRFQDRDELLNVNGFRTFRQVAFGGSFEGYTIIGVGVRARLPFRVLVLPGPGSGNHRLVVDVAHRW